MAEPVRIHAGRDQLGEVIGGGQGHRISIGQYRECLHNQLGLCQPQTQSLASVSIAGMSQVPAR